MALIGILRNKMGKIVVGAIMVTMLSFILTDMIGNSTIMGGGQNPDIAEMDGETITNERFQAKVNELSYNFSLNTGRNPSQDEIAQIRDQAWNALIVENVYEEQFEELGVDVSLLERQDMVTGSNISPLVQQLPFLADPETGVFSKENLDIFLANIASGQTQGGEREFWLTLENGTLVPYRKFEKYSSLLAKTNYVTKYEAQEEYNNQSASASLEYVYVPYLTVSDSTVEVTDAELRDYLRDHEEEFKREESRSIEYVVFDMTPSPEDSAFLKNEVEEIAADLANAANDSSFVAINSDDPYSFLTYQINNLPAQLKDGDNAQPEGFISQPEIVNGNYEFYKLSRIDRITRDSVLYRVAKVRKEFFVSDETINAIYRDADLFAANSGNTEEFRKNAEEQGLRVLKADGVDRNAQRVGVINEGRTIVLWLYRDAVKGAVSDVKEIGETYVVATMTEKQEEGLANLESVRNQVTTLVRNEKKGEQLVSTLNNMGTNDLNEIASNYGEEARTGTADVQLFSNNISTVGYAPEVIGLSFALNEEENTRAFKVRDGVVMVKLVTKDMPEAVEDYTTFKQQIAQRRLGYTTLIGTFPFTYFPVYVSRNVDEAVKEFADIEDMRYMFF